MAAGAVATVIGTQITGGGQQSLTYNAVATGTVIDSGTQIVGGDDHGTAVASNTTLAGQYASELVSSGGTTVNTHISNGAEFVSSSGISSDTVISSGGTEYVVSGGTASNTTVDNGGTLQLFDGYALAPGFTINAGGTLELGGYYDDNTFNETPFEVSGYQVSGTTLALQSGGIASNTTVDGGGTLDVQAGGEVVGALTFAGTGVLQIDGPNLPTDPETLIAATVSGFVPGNTIDLTGIANVAGSHADINYSTDLLTMTEGSNTYDLQLAGDFTGDYFHLAGDGANGSKITEDQIACYCCGTLILTPTGEMPVEDLAIDDYVMTFSGRARPIKWIGRRSYAGRFLTGNRHVLPIVVKAGALADGVPTRDLLVSPEHALYLDAVLVPARLLINDVTIVQVADVKQVEYFHVELDRHDVIFAERAPAESFVDDDSRFMFHNALEFSALYPDMARGSALYCAPRVEDGFALEELRRELLKRVQRLDREGRSAPATLQGQVDVVSHDRIAGWAFDPTIPDTPVPIVILDNGAEIGRVVADHRRRDLTVGGIGTGCHGFELIVPGGLDTALPHEIAVYGGPDWTLLPGAPVGLLPEETAVAA